MYALYNLTFPSHLLLIIFFISHSTYLKFKHLIIIMCMLSELKWNVLKSGVSCIKIVFMIIHLFIKYLWSSKCSTACSLTQPHSLGVCQGAKERIVSALMALRILGSLEVGR